MLLARQLICSLVGFAAVLSTAPHAAAQVSFKDKTVTMFIGSEPGGGTDATGRVIAPFLKKYLPGEPNIVTQNIPGANGIASLNSFLRRAQTDGLSVIMSSNLAVDPLVYRNSVAQFDPKSFRFFGGVSRGGTIIFIAPKAATRLYDRSAPPVVIGSVVGMPRVDIQPAIWCTRYLGWNTKWISGYHGTNEVMLAFDRGEVDMASTGNIFQIQQRLKSDHLKIINQSGSFENGKIVERSEFGDAPLFLDQLKGKVTDQIAMKGLDYWTALSNLDKWIGLPPETPDDIVATYRTAFARISADKEFVERGEKISDGFVPIAGADVQNIVRTLGDTPQAAIEYIKTMMRAQGLRMQ